MRAVRDYLQEALGSYMRGLADKDLALLEDFGCELACKAKQIIRERRPPKAGHVISSGKGKAEE